MSKYARRISVRLSVRGAGFRPLAMTGARRKASIFVAAPATFGATKRFAGMNAQWVDVELMAASEAGQCAPDATQPVNAAISEAGSLPDGGILCLPSYRMACTSGLATASPGNTAFTAPAAVSRRSPPRVVFALWQGTQCLCRRGRIRFSKSNSSGLPTFADGSFACGVTCPATTVDATAKIPKIPNNVRFNAMTPLPR